MTGPLAPTRRPGGRVSAGVLLVVAVLIGLLLGRFLTAGDDAPAVTTTRVAAAAGLAERTAQLEAAVEGDPTDVASLQALAVAYVDRAAETGDPAFYGLATGALDRAEAVAPGQPDTLLARGLLSLALHDFGDALELGEQARAQRPRDAGVLGVVIDAEVELGRYPAAAETLQELLDRRPELPALARASYLRELNGDRDGAIAAMQAAEAAGSSSPFSVAVVVTLLGDLLLDTGDLAAAGEAYDRALRDAPGLLLAEVGRARVQAASGDLDGAVADLVALTDRQPSVAALTLLAELQDLSGDPAGAEATAEVVRAVATLQGVEGQVVDLEMALFEADRGRSPRAIELAQRAYDARPDNVFVNDALAWARFSAGDVAGALPLVEQAVRLGTADPLLRYHAAEVLAADGQTERAAVELAVTAASPWFSFVHQERAGELARELGVTAPPAWG